MSINLPATGRGPKPPVGAVVVSPPADRPTGRAPPSVLNISAVPPTPEPPPGKSTLSKIIGFATGLDPIKTPPFLKPNPGFLFWFAPHAFGGVTPNEWWGVPEDLSFWDTLRLLGDKESRKSWFSKWEAQRSREQAEVREKVRPYLKSLTNAQLEAERQRLLLLAAEGKPGGAILPLAEFIQGERSIDAIGEAVEAVGSGAYPPGSDTNGTIPGSFPVGGIISPLALTEQGVTIGGKPVGKVWMGQQWKADP